MPGIRERGRREREITREDRQTKLGICGLKEREG
jgi:hypothetical protein